MIRADNSFAVPLLTEYARSLQEHADALEGEFADLAFRLRVRASEIAGLAIVFEAWGDIHPEKVKPDRTVTPADPGESAHIARRRFRERATAHDRDVTELRASLESARRDLQRMTEERDRLAVELQRARPTQHVTALPTPR